MKPHMLSQIQEQQVCNEYLIGKGSHELGIKFGLSDSGILTILKRYNIKRRTNSEAHLGLQVGAKNGNFGKPLPEWHKELLRKYRTGKPGPIISDEMKQKLRKQKLGKNNPMFGKHFSENAKKKLSDKLRGRTGEKSNGWRGGLTPLNKIIRSYIKYDIWRSTIFIRDDFTCHDCGSRGMGLYLNAHHLKPLAIIIRLYQIKTLEEAILCEELWDINNGITLCEKCHNRTKGRHRDGNHRSVSG